MHIGLVGCGRWGRLILRDLIALGCTVAVVARSDESRRRAAEGGAVAIVGSIADLDGVDGVVVATPTSTHHEVVAEALDHSVPVFVEKPLTNEPTTVDALVERGGSRLFVMDKWRYHPGVEAMAAMADTGEFGSVRAISSRRVSWGSGHDDVDAVWVLLPHDLAIVHEIVGYLPPAVAAVGTRGVGQYASLTGLLGPEPACVIEVSDLSPIRERRIAVEFDQAVVLLTDAYASSLKVMRKGGEGGEEERALPDDMPLVKELAAFVEHLRGGPPPRSSAAEGAQAVHRIAELRGMAGI